MENSRPDKPVRDTAQQKAAALEALRELFHFRDLVFQMVRRDIVTRYKRSLLGVAWTMLSPLGMMAVLAVVFSQLMPTERGYPAYILSGLVAWNFFSQSTTTAIAYLVDGGGLIKVIYLPPTAFVFNAVGTGLVNLLLSLLPLLAVMAVLGLPLGWTILFAPLPILLLVGFTVGVGLMVSALAVYFRDTAAIYQLILTAWIYLSPVFFPENLLNPDFRFWLSILNPLYILLRLFRMPLYDGRLPAVGELAWGGGVALLFLAVGWILFTQKSDEFSYRI